MKVEDLARSKEVTLWEDINGVTHSTRQEALKASVKIKLEALFYCGDGFSTAASKAAAEYVQEHAEEFKELLDMLDMPT